MATARIMCLGDSLVVGNEAATLGARSFRGRLQSRIVNGNYLSDFIGTQSSTPAIGGDPDHEGYAGSTIAAMTARIPTILAGGVGVDIIIVLIGWADVIANTGSIGTVYGTLIGDIDAAKPSAEILICTLPPYSGLSTADTGATYPAYATLNTAIRALASGNIAVVDLAAISGSGGSTSARTAFLEEIISETKKASDWLRGGPNGEFTISNPYGGCRFLDWKGMSEACYEWSYNPPGAVTSPGSSYGDQYGFDGQEQRGHPRFIQSVSQSMPWWHAWLGPGHTATNTGIEVRNMFFATVNADGSWTFMFSGARASGWFWTGYPSDGPRITHFGNVPAGCTFRQQPDGITTFWRATGAHSPEAWAHDRDPSLGPHLSISPYKAENRAAVVDSVGWLVGCQVRLALDDPNGPNDTDRACYLSQIGYDMQAVQGGNLMHTAKVTTSSGVFTLRPRYDWISFPYNAIDLNASRYREIRSTDWTFVGGFSGSWQGINPGLGGPWGVGFPFNKWIQSDYGISEAQLRANPPPLPPYWTTNVAGGGFATSDYLNSSTFEFVQSGADILAQTIYDRMIALGTLTGYESTSGPSPEPAPGGSTRPVYLEQKTGGLWTYAASEQAAQTAPQWITETGTSVTVAVGGVPSFTMRASGAPAPTYSKVSGPAWLTVNSTTGALGGTEASGVGSYLAVIRASNGITPNADITLTIVVVPVLSIVTTTLPAAIATQPYSAAITVVGREPIVLSATGLVTGLALSGRIVLGTPTGATATATFTATDALGDTATRNIEIVVGAAGNVPAITTTSLTAATASTAYTFTLTGTGTGPLTWSIPPGQLPSGFSLNTSTGEISGTTTADGGYVLTVTLTGLLGNATRQFSLSVLAAGATEPIASPWARWTRG
jgi:hypothetical protein